MDKKINWNEEYDKIFTDKELEQLLMSAHKTSAYLQLYKSSKNSLSRSLVIAIAEEYLDAAEYCILIKFCLQHIEDLIADSMKKSEIPDEPFTYW